MWCEFVGICVGVRVCLKYVCVSGSVWVCGGFMSVGCFFCVAYISRVEYGDF